jgi:tyrosinase
MVARSSFLSTRRQMIVGTAAAAVTLLGASKRACADLSKRPDIASAAGKTMVSLYAAAVRAMQDPAINYPPQPQSWTFQAYIHAVPLNPFDPADSGGVYGSALKKRVDQIYGDPAPGTQQAAWKQAALACWATCEHASPYFTTWHRWYLFYFERICRKMCGHSEFQLPYWNYASDNNSSLQLPEQFRAVSPDLRNPNVLFFDDRGLGFAEGSATGPQNVAMNDGGFMPYLLTQYGPALSAKKMFPSDNSANATGDPTDPKYLGFGFTGRLECVPHDNVHGYVGGWMQKVPSAAGDPIFYMHHSQIDRLYAAWEAEPSTSYNWGSSDSDPDEITWKTKKMGAFVDENGRLIGVTLGDAIDTAALGYAYDALPSPPPSDVISLLTIAPRQIAGLKLAAMETHDIKVLNGGSTVTLEPAAKAESINPGAAASPASHTLTLKGIKLLRRPPAPLAVFINLPSGTPPRLHNPYYVGTLNLFNFDLSSGGIMDHSDDDMHANHAATGATAQFDVTDVLTQQRAKGLWTGGAVTITISTIGADTPGTITYITIDSASITP